MTEHQSGFIQAVPPEVLEETVDSETFRESFPSAHYVEFDPLDFLKYLPELEAEIFWMVRVRSMSQQDIGILLGLSQPAISHRYRRAVEKIAYLVVLTALNVEQMVHDLPFLTLAEKAIMTDLFFYLHQDAVGKIHGGLRQSSVKWIALKTRRKLEDLERKDPERWFNHLGLIYLLFRYLGLRLKST